MEWENDCLVVCGQHVASVHRTTNKLGQIMYYVETHLTHDNKKYGNYHNREGAMDIAEDLVWVFINGAL